MYTSCYCRAISKYLAMCFITFPRQARGTVMTLNIYEVIFIIVDTLIISRYLGKSSKIPEKVKVDSDRTDMIDNLFLFYL